MSSFFIKESYVYTLPLNMNDPKGETRWVGCECGYLRNLKHHSELKDVPLRRMFKLNGRQTCERCVNAILDMCYEVLEDE